MSRPRIARWTGVVLVVLGVALLPGMLCAQDAAESDSVLPEEAIDLRRADLDALLTLPGMDAATAGALLVCRRQAELDLDGLLACAGAPTARSAEWRDALFWEPEAPGPATAASVALRGSSETPDPRESDVPIADATLRRELKVRGRARGFGAAFRVNRDRTDPEAGADSFSVAGVVRIRAFDGALAGSIGDLAPHEGLGLLFGVTARAAPRGVVPYRAPGSALEGWTPLRSEALDRAAPSTAGRRLRGASVLLRGRLHLSVFRYHPGDTGTGVDSLAPRLMLPGEAAGLWIGAAPGSAPRGRWYAGPRLLRLDGRYWPGLVVGREAPGVRFAAEGVRDPGGRLRGGVTLERAADGSVFGWSLQLSAPDFVNPLGSDSERSPLREGPVGEGRNAAAAGAGLALRHRVRPALWVHAAAAATLEPPGTRRAYRRGRGDVSAGLDAALGSGWSSRAELRFETRTAPGPADGVEAPLRRPTLLVRIHQDGKGRRLSAGWSTRADLEQAAGGATAPAVATVALLADLRGRVRVARDLWIGGGLAQFDLPTGGLMSLYEERPRELPGAVTLRGRGTRGHTMMEVTLPFGTAGVYLSRERVDGRHKTFWGSILRISWDSSESGGAN